MYHILNKKYEKELHIKVQTIELVSKLTSDKEKLEHDIKVLLFPHLYISFESVIIGGLILALISS